MFVIREAKVVLWDYLFIFFLNEGHVEVPSSRKQDHEEGLNSGNLSDNLFLSLLWMLWIRGFRGQNTRKSPDGLRVLRALLAH